MKVFIKENTWLNRSNFSDFGWGNGYVVIPKGHPLHGKGYDEIHDLIPELNINGGITLSESVDNLDWKELPEGIEGCWVVGFDTTHSWDTLEHWTKRNVYKEAKSLRDQLINYK